MIIYRHHWKDHDTVYINDVFGFVLLAIYQDGTASIYDLIVYPQFRGKGNGKKLMNKAISIAKFEGCSMVCLWPDCEEFVKEWYKKLGFVPGENVEDPILDYEGVPGWGKPLK